MPNLYDDLELPSDGGSTGPQIKAAYKRLAQKYHPDKNEKDTSEQFTRVKHAYEVLSDKEQRAHYDETGSEDNSQEKKENDAAYDLMLSTITSSIQSNEYMPLDYIEDAQVKLYRQLGEGEQDIKKLNLIIVRIRYLIDNIEGEPITDFLNVNLQRVEQMNERNEITMNVIRKAIKLLQNSEFSFNGEAPKAKLPAWPSIVGQIEVKPPNFS